MSYNNVNVNVSGPKKDYTSTYKTYILRGNMSFADQVTEPNVKYVVKYDFDLDGGTVTIPEGCLLEFDGGTVSNGTIEFDNTILIYNQQEEDVLKNITVVGDYEVSAGGKGDKKDNVNGMGKIYLKKNKGFAEQLTQDNTIYVIQYDFDLGEESVTIPENCILEFDGGSLSNGTIVGKNTGVQAGLVKIFDINVTLTGTWSVTEAYPEWFGAKGDDITNDTISFNKTLNAFSTIVLYYGKTYLLDTVTGFNTITINGNQACLHFSNNNSMILNYESNNIRSVSNLSQSDKTVNISVDGEISKYNIGSIIKLYSEDLVGNSSFKCSQYFVITNIENNTIICNGSLQFDFITNPKICLLQNKTCNIRNIVLKGERTEFTEIGLITIKGGILHSVDCIIESISAHGVAFYGCYGYNAKAKVLNQQFAGTTAIIGMGIIDQASSNFVVEIQSENSQQFTTVYTSDGSVDCIGMSQYGLIKGCVLGDSIDVHSNGFRLTYDGIVISNNASMGIGCRSHETTYNNIISYASIIGAYIYNDTNNLGNKLVTIKNSEFINCKTGILCTTGSYPNTVILKSCKITAETSLGSGSNNVLIYDSILEGNIQASGGNIYVINSTIKNCKLQCNSLTIINSDIEINRESYVKDLTMRNCIFRTTDSSFSVLRTLADDSNLDVYGCVFYIKSSAIFIINKVRCNIKIKNSSVFIEESTEIKTSFAILNLNTNGSCDFEIDNLELYNNTSRGLTSFIVPRNTTYTGTVNNIIFKKGSSDFNINIQDDINVADRNYYHRTGSSSLRPTYKIPRGFQYFDTTLMKPIYWNGIAWIDATKVRAGTPTSGTFANKPTVSDNAIPIGFKYFCTDKQTTEGATDGIEIIHKGNNVWVDALGRVVS